jgi:sugar phosphate isomerase/epimerase
MTMFNRFKRCAAVLALLGVGCTFAQAAPATPRIGVQLWSVKDEVRQDFEGTLDKLAKLGFQGVEFAGEFGRFANDAAGLRRFLDKTGLRCAGAHVQFDALSAARFDATTAFYKTAGCSNLIIPREERASSREGAAQVALELTTLSARLAPLGMRIGYHNHDWEMAGADGRTPWDVIATGTPAGSIMEQDVGWTTLAGKDPVAIVERYPGRTVSTHYKVKFPPGTSGTPIIGQDKIDWAGLVMAARSVGGTEWIIVEQEEYPNGMSELEAVAASMHGLQAVLAKLPAK